MNKPIIAAMACAFAITSTAAMAAPDITRNPAKSIQQNGTSDAVPDEDLGAVTAGESLAQTISQRLRAVSTDLRQTLNTDLGNVASTISNVLKTRHDTVKNSIGNIR